MEKLEKLFKLKENNTDIKTELIAGLTTFFTMSYLLFLSPRLLEIAGMELNASITVTSFCVFLFSTITAFVSNKPFVTAPFLGSTAFIAYSVCSLGFSIKTTLAAILICGILLFIMTLTNLRTYILEQISENIKISYCAGLGLFFIFLALKYIGIINFSAASLSLEAANLMTLPCILGLFCTILIIALSAKGIKIAVLASIIITTLLGIIFRDIQLPSNIVSLPPSLAPSFLQTDFSGLLSKSFIPIFFVLFLLVNIDTSGALISLNLNMNSKPKKKEMISDSIAVMLSPIFGTTTSGAYMDSMTGMNAGGKTGLTALTTGILFLLGVLFTPLISIIPPYAYAPALLYVGILMFSSISKIDFSNISEAAPAILTISIMIFTSNIGIGIISAFITYPLIKLLCGEKNKTNIITWIMFVLSVVFFIIYPY